MSRRLKHMPTGYYEGVYGRLFSWLGTVVALLLGAVLVVAAAALGGARPVEAVLVLLVGLSFIAGAVAGYEAALHRPGLLATDLVTVVDEGAPGVRVPCNRRVYVTLAVSTVPVVAALGVGAVMAAGVGRVVLVVLASIVGLLGGNLFVLLSRTRWLVLSTNGVSAGSPHQTGRLAWDDVEAVTWDASGTKSMVFRLRGRAGAPSWQCWRHSWLVPPARPWLDVETLSIDLDPMLLGMALRSYWKYPSMRSELASGAVRQRLLDPMFALATTPPDVAAEFVAKFRPRGT